MSMKQVATIFLALSAVCAPSAFAQQINIQPGLWLLDMTVPGKPKGNPLAGYVEQMKSRMASLPPEQRKELEKMMADLDARGTEFTDNGLRTKHCITKEDIAKYDLLGTKGPDGCTHKATPALGGVNLSMVCTQPPMKVDAAVKFQSDKAYSFESVTTATGPDGKAMTQKSSCTGKWLSSSCGNVRPASASQ